MRKYSTLAFYATLLHYLYSRKLTKEIQRIVDNSIQGTAYTCLSFGLWMDRTVDKM